MDDQDSPAAALGRLERQLAEVGRKVDEMHAELELFRPLLRLFRPNGGGSDLQRAGVARALRKAARGG